MQKHKKEPQPRKSRVTNQTHTKNVCTQQMEKRCSLFTSPPSPHFLEHVWTPSVERQTESEHSPQSQSLPESRQYASVPSPHP